MEELFNKPHEDVKTKECWFCKMWNNPKKTTVFNPDVFYVINENLPKCEICGNQLEEEK